MEPGVTNLTLKDATIKSKKTPLEINGNDNNITLTLIGDNRLETTNTVFRGLEVENIGTLTFQGDSLTMQGRSGIRTYNEVCALNIASGCNVTAIGIEEYALELNDYYINSITYFPTLDIYGSLTAITQSSNENYTSINPSKEITVHSGGSLTAKNEGAGIGLDFYRGRLICKSGSTATITAENNHAAVFATFDFYEGDSCGAEVMIEEGCTFTANGMGDNSYGLCSLYDWPQKIKLLSQNAEIQGTAAAIGLVQRNTYFDGANNRHERIFSHGSHNSITWGTNQPMHAGASRATAVPVEEYHQQKYLKIGSMPVVPSAPGTPDASAPPSAPKTGDDANLALWLGLMAASLLGMAGMKRRAGRS